MNSPDKDSPLIFVVEDEADIARLICATLGEYGFRSESFATGRSPERGAVAVNTGSRSPSALVTRARAARPQHPLVIQRLIELNRACLTFGVK